jgi:CRP-like cAMP-binding protein
MDTQRLEQFITSILSMPIDKAKLFATQFDYFELKKNGLLLQDGKTSRETYFLEEGFIRSSTISNEGEDVTTDIFSAPCFVNDFLSFFKQVPTNEDYQALTNCKIWKMNFEIVQKNFHTYPEFREFGRLMLVSNYSILHERMIDMIKNTAEQRYLKLLKKHPDIFKNVPLKIIASYLGVTDTSLSRIRKEISKSDFLPNDKTK